MKCKKILRNKLHEEVAVCEREHGHSGRHYQSNGCRHVSWGNCKVSNKWYDLGLAILESKVSLVLTLCKFVHALPCDECKVKAICDIVNEINDAVEK